MKYAIISGGEVRDNQWFVNAVKEYNPDFVIAADYGYNYCIKNDVVPDLIIGDFDSFPQNNVKADDQKKVIKYSPIKDSTDTEIAVDYCIKNNAAEVRIFAATGKRFDHFFAVVLLLKKLLDNNIAALICDEYNDIMLIKEDKIFKDMQGRTISFMPVGKGGIISLDGFRYPLDKYLMESYDALGVSNYIEKKEAFVKIEDGIFIVVICK